MKKYEYENVRDLFVKNESSQNPFIYRPPDYKGPDPIHATIGVKFSVEKRVLDSWHMLGGTRWSRTFFRIKHPIVYSKRGLLGLYRRIKKIFIKEKRIRL